jgi:cob(I)alamin adenosyltransferase
MIHLYTGDGKGKTTAALGLALRAAGAGWRVFIGQFVKGMPYSEIELIRQRIPEISIQQYGRGCFIYDHPTAEDMEAARAGLSDIGAKIAGGAYQLVVLDEVCIALHYSLFRLDELVKVLNGRPPEVEIVLTGRKAPPELVNIADLVTDMREIKHYYARGVKARKGIEY